MADLYANFATTTLAGGAGGVGTALNNGDATLYVSGGTGGLFPSPANASQRVRLVISNSSVQTQPEIVYATGRSGDTFTGLARAQEGSTTPASWPATGATVITNDETAGGLNLLWTRIADHGFNVREFGATGNGTTDDTAAIQAALTAAVAAGGGVVFLPPGTYMLSSSPHPNNSAMYTCLRTGAKVWLRGSGMDATILRLNANQHDNSRLITNSQVLTSLGTFNTTAPTYPPTTGYDTQITISDLTLDGNNTNQGAATATYGLDIQCAVGVRVERVRAINILGTTGLSNLPGSGVTDPCYPSGAGIGIGFYSSDRVSVCECEATGEGGGNTGTGFRDAACASVAYVACLGHDHSVGSGFVSAASASMRATACHAFSNSHATTAGTYTGHGFVNDSLRDALYDGCVSGNQTGFVGSYPSANGTAKGNGADGFVANGTVMTVLLGCASNYNAYQGVEMYGGGELVIVGGEFRASTHNAIYVSGTGQLTIVGRPLMYGGGNDALPISITGLGQVPPAGPLTAPTVPGSGTAYVNPFPYPVFVIVSGGTVAGVFVTPYFHGGYGTQQSIATATPAYVFLQPSDKIQLNYSVAPTWTWQGVP